MKNKILLTAALSVICFFIADPLFGIWAGIIASFCFYLYTHKLISAFRQRELWACYYSFFFYFSVKVLTIRGLLYGFVELYDHTLKGFVSFIVFIAIESFIPMLSALLIQFFFVREKKWFFAPAIVLILTVANYYSYIWIPQGVEIPLSQQAWILASAGYLGAHGIAGWGFLVSTCLYMLTQRNNFSKLATLSLVLIFAAPIAAGYWRKQNFIESMSRSIPVYLIQTNQSDLAKRSVDWGEVINSLPVEGDPEEARYFFFPEGTTRSDSPHLNRLTTHLKNSYKNFNLYIGVEIADKDSIKKEIWSINSSDLIKKFSKQVYFPIGESEVSMPFLPGTWLRPKIKLSSDNHREVFPLDNVQLLPLVGYEGVVSGQYDKLLKMSDKTSSSVFVNFSKDSFFESNSGPDWLNYYVRLKTSELGRSMVRISTNSYSGVISPWGEVVIMSDKNKFQVIHTNLPIYAETFSFWD